MVDDGGGLFQISNEKKTIVIQKKNFNKCRSTWLAISINHNNIGT